jgi:hypothetical protein
LKVRVPFVVIGLPPILKSVPVVPVTAQTSVTVPPASVTVNVTVSVLSSVVIAIPEPSNVSVSALLSAVIVFCPDTAIDLKIHCEEPLSVLQTVIEPLLVIGLPEIEIPVPAVKPTLVTVPTQSVLELKVDQSEEDKAPLFVALAVGTFKVMFPLLVTGVPVTFTSEPAVPVQRPTLVTVPVHEVDIVQIVKVSLEAFVKTDILFPPTTVRVSVLLSATIVSCPATAIHLNIHWSEPLSELVTVIDPLPVIGLPETEIPEPAVRPTLVTVPVQSVLLLNVFQSVDDK